MPRLSASHSSHAIAACSALFLVASGGLAQAQTASTPLRVRVAFSPDLQARHGWLKQLHCAVNRANVLLEPAVGHRLELTDWVVWRVSGAVRSVASLRSHLGANVEPGEADIVLGLLPAASAPAPLTATWNPGTERHDEGLASYTRGNVVLKVDGGDLCATYRLLAHEVGHVFGGVHRQGRHFLMNPAAPGEKVDPLNAELFSLHRDRRFGPGIAPLDGQELRTLWRLARAGLSEPGTWVVVGTLAARIGKIARAVHYYETALELRSDHRPALVALGHAQLQLGNLAAAEQYYRRSLDLFAADGLVHNNLATIYLTTGDVAQAVTHARTALNLGFDVDPGFVAAVEEASGTRLRRRDR